MPLRDPGLAKPGNLAVAGDLHGIAGDPVDPCIADFLGDDREVTAVGLDRIGNFGEAGGDDSGVGKLTAEIGVDVYDLLRRMRAAVVVAHNDGDGQIGARHRAPRCRSRGDTSR